MSKKGRQISLIVLVLVIFILSIYFVSALVTPSLPVIIDTAITSSNSSSNRSIDNLYANWSWIGESGTEVSSALGWNKTFSANNINSFGGKGDNAYDVAVDSLGNVFVVGFSANASADGSGFDCLIKKYSSAGVENASWNITLESRNGANGQTCKANGIDIDADDNVYVAMVTDGTGNEDQWLKKYDKYGTEDANWNLSFHLNGNDGYNKIVVDSNKSVIAVGYYSPANDDMHIHAFNASNVSRWSHNYTGPTNNADQFRDVAVDTQNNVYAVGYMTNMVGLNSSRDWIIKKYLENGSEVVTDWNKTFDSNNGYDEAEGVVVDSNDNIYVVGAAGNLTGAGTNKDVWIKKFLANGSEVTTNWNKSFTSAGSTADGALSVTVDSNDSVYVVGVSSAGASPDVFIRKYNSSGVGIAAFNYTLNGGAGVSFDFAYGVRVDNRTDDVYMVGILTDTTSGQDWWIKKFAATTNNYSDSEVRWYKNAHEQHGLKNMTNVSSGNLTVGDVWSFGVRSFDGLDWSPWVNTSVNLTVLVSTSTSSSSSSSSSSGGSSSSEGKSSSSSSDDADAEAEDEESEDVVQGAPEAEGSSSMDLDDLWQDGVALVEGLSEEEPYTFTFVDEEEHTATVSDINEDEGTVTLTIESDPLTVALSLDVAREVDLDGDGLGDLVVTLESFNEDGTVDITFEKSEAWQLAESEDVEESSSLPGWVLPVIIIVVLVVLALVIVLANKKK